MRSLLSAERFDRFDETEAVSDMALFGWLLIRVIVVSKDFIGWHCRALASGEVDYCC